MGFDEIVGNEPAKMILKRAIEKDRVSNAYVFEGIAGIGKKLAADIFARGLVCENREQAPCGICSACRKAIAKGHPDIIYLEKEKDKKSIGVEEVRSQILSEVYMKPYLSPYRVFIIGEGDILSVGAQNALLKILEEPPPYATFVICVTSQEKLLDTVLSRSCTVAFFPLSFAEITSYLEKDFALDDRTRLFARLSQGSIGKATELLSDEDAERLYEDSVAALLRLKKDASNVREVADFLTAEKERISEVTDFFQTFLRDCIFIKSGMGEQVVYENKKTEMFLFCETVSKKALIQAFDRLTEFRLRLKQNINYNASVAETVMCIWEDFHG
ncbi:MAG: DNA polymerase III subunit delta' [Clostridia bacterium]|nr:DNA polymerase III subunit delta' [Clostridia bacterium]